MENGKMIFKSIKDVLSRDEMKKIVAGSGINCISRVQYQDGTFFSTAPGLCSGSSIGQCVYYGIQNCQSLLYGSQGSCSTSCY